MDACDGSSSVFFIFEPSHFSSTCHTLSFPSSFSRARDKDEEISKPGISLFFFNGPEEEDITNENISGPKRKNYHLPRAHCQKDKTGKRNEP